MVVASPNDTNLRFVVWIVYVIMNIPVDGKLVNIKQQHVICQADRIINVTTVNCLIFFTKYAYFLVQYPLRHKFFYFWDIT